MHETIDICLAANAKYFPGMFTTAASIAMHANPSCRLSFNLLETDVADADYEELVRCVARLHENVEFHRFNVAKYDFKSLQTWHGNRLAYARFLIGELRPDLEYVIYSDVDMLWLADVAELWSLRDVNVSVMGPYDGHSKHIGEDKNFAKQGYAFDESKYYCSGLLLMNLKRMREKHISERCIEFLRDNHSFICPDQSALNIITVDDSRILPRMWMKFTFDIQETTIQAPIVLHYANEIPWLRRRNDLLTDSVLLWFKIFACAKGQTLLSCLKQEFSLGYIITARFMFLAMTNKMIAFVFHCCLALMGKSDRYWGMKYWAHRFRLSGTKQLYC